MTSSTLRRSGSKRNGRYHVLDLENLVSGGGTRELCERWFAVYARTVGVRPSDSGIGAGIACVADIGASVFSSTVHIHTVPPGRDEADRFLLAAVDPDAVARRHRRIVIASGDHAFLPLLRQFQELGCQVTVVVPSWTNCHHDLRDRADNLVVLDGTTGWAHPAKGDRDAWTPNATPTRSGAHIPARRVA